MIWFYDSSAKTYEQCFKFGAPNTNLTGDVVVADYTDAASKVSYKTVATATGDYIFRFGVDLDRPVILASR